MRLKVERMTAMRTNIGICVYLSVFAHDEPAKRPVTVTNGKTSGIRVPQLVGMHDQPFRPATPGIVISQARNP